MLIKDDKRSYIADAGGAGGTPPTPPAPPAPAPGAGTPPTPPAAPDATKTAEELGRMKAENEQLKKFRDDATPILETLAADQDLLKKATEVHNKRLGKPTPPTAPEVPTAPPSDPEARQFILAKTYNDFESKVGIDKLSGEDQTKMRQAVGAMLKNMLDPKGNKTTVEEVLKDVSLVRLPWYLESAYSLLNKDSDITKAREEGKNEVINGYNNNRGIMSGMPSSTPSGKTITLSQEQRKAAVNMNISEEDYLKELTSILEDK